MVPPPDTQSRNPPGVRIPLTCSECSRRKIKCDKQVPCRACTERGTPETCHRQRISRPVSRLRAAVPGNNYSTTNSPVRVPQDIYHELATLRKRLDRVENELEIERHGDKRASDSDEGDVDATITHSAQGPVKEDGLVGAMEEAALGIGENRRWQGDSLAVDNATLSSNHAGHGFSQSVSFEACLSAMPSREEAQYLLESFCGCVNWISGCLHEPTLRRQHEAFWNQYQRGCVQDEMLNALFFAVWSVAGYFHDEKDAQSQGFDPQRLNQGAATWFNCSLATIFRCDGLTHPSLPACHTILILHYSFHLSRNSRIHGALTYLVVGFARTMNLHLLGSQRQGSRDRIVQLEIGRRIWWNIVQQEWYFLPYHSCRSASIHTSLPELTDEGEIASSSHGFHSLSFFHACCKSSRLLYDLYGTLPPNKHPLHEAVLKVSRRLDEVVAELPPELQQSAELGVPSEERSDITYTRRFLGMMLAYRSYLIHRSYYVKSLREEAYKYSHTACLRAAETILTLSDKGLPPTFYRLWNTTLWLVAAGIVLCLDMIHAARLKQSSLDIAARRRRLAGLVYLLENLADDSGIGYRGAKLVSQLCKIEQDISDGSSSGPHFTREDILQLVRPKGADVSMDQDNSAGFRNNPGPEDVYSFPATSVVSDLQSQNDFSPASNEPARAIGFSDPAMPPSMWANIGTTVGMGGGVMDDFSPIVERTQYSDVFSFFGESFTE